MFSTYQSQDVTILLKDIIGLVTPLAPGSGRPGSRAVSTTRRCCPWSMSPPRPIWPPITTPWSGMPALQRRLWPGRRSRFGRAGEGSAPWSPGPGRDAHRHSDPPLSPRPVRCRPPPLHHLHHSGPGHRPQCHGLSPGPPRPWRYPVRGRLDPARAPSSGSWTQP